MFILPMHYAHKSCNSKQCNCYVQTDIPKRLLLNNAAHINNTQKAGLTIQNRKMYRQ